MKVLPVFGEPKADLFVVVPDGEARSGALNEMSAKCVSVSMTCDPEVVTTKITPAYILVYPMYALLDLMIPCRTARGPQERNLGFSHQLEHSVTNDILNVDVHKVSCQMPQSYIAFRPASLQFDCRMFLVRRESKNEDRPFSAAETIWLREGPGCKT